MPAHLRNVLHLHREQSPQHTDLSVPSAPVDQLDAPSESPLERATGMMARGELQAAIELVLTLEPSLHAAYLLLTCARDLQSPQQAALALEYISTHHLQGLIDGASARLRDDLAWLEQFTQAGPRLDWRTWLDALASRFHEAGCPAGGQESRKCL